MTKKWFTGLKTDQLVSKHVNEYALEENGKVSSQKKKMLYLYENQNQKS